MAAAMGTCRTHTVVPPFSTPSSIAAVIRPREPASCLRTAAASATCGTSATGTARIRLTVISTGERLNAPKLKSSAAAKRLRRAILRRANRPPPVCRSRRPFWPVCSCWCRWECRLFVSCPAAKSWPGLELGLFRFPKPPASFAGGFFVLSDGTRKRHPSGLVLLTRVRTGGTFSAWMTWQHSGCVN